MPRFEPGAALLLCAAGILFVTCDAPPSSDLLSPDVPVHEIVDGRTADSSNVYLLPPIGESYHDSVFDEYTPTRVELCSLADPNEGVPLEEYTDAMWDELGKKVSCLDADADPWFAYYQENSSSDGVTFIELKRDTDGNAEHYQLNLKTEDGMAAQAFRVTVFTLSGAPDSGVYWEEKARFGLALFENSSAINVPDNWVGETAGQNFPVKYKVEWQESDSFAVEVDCDGGTFVGITAGISVRENTFDGCDGGDTTLVLVQEPVDLDPEANEVCLPVGWEQDGPCYRWQLYTFDGNTYEPYDGVIPENKPLTVAYCLTPSSEVYDERWSGFKTPAPYDTYVTPTINTNSGFDYLLDCPLEAKATGFAGMLQRVRQFLALDPQPLYAAHRGFGELVGGTLSHFGRAKAQTLPEDSASGSGQSGLINTTLPEPLVVQALTIPHQEGSLQVDGSYLYHVEDPLPVVNQAVTFEVVDGGGTLTAGDQTDSVLTVKTDRNGYAQVSWTLGPDASPPDQTVIAYGDGLGTLVDSVFVADTIWFFATAYDVVTDFLEPLDEKDGFSGEPYTQAAPHVLLCEVPADGWHVAQPCPPDPSPEFTEADLKLTDDNGRWFYQVNWKPREFDIASGVYVVQVVLDGGLVVGESVKIVVEKGGKVELADGQLQINPTTDLPIKFTLSRIAP